MPEQVFKNKKDLINILIPKDAAVLDVGFWGQGVGLEKANWPHRLLKEKTDKLFGLDLVIDLNKLAELGFNQENYFQVSAENFSLGKKFEVIFAGDLIEHLSNPGLFLECCKKHLTENGMLILTTPNCFNLFNLAGKITRLDPVTNSDHTCFFTLKTLSKLLDKNNFKVENYGYLYNLEVVFQRSLKQKFLDLIYWILSKFTNKYLETLVVIAK